jgi:CheY-like chemotaxis protein
MVESTFPAEIKINNNIDADPDMINGDATQIHQVLMNLCTNALHAMDNKSGILSINLDNYHLKQTKKYQNMEIPTGNYIRIQVSDNGCGMTPEVQNRIFEPYFTTKKVEQGTGLGLSVTMGIVQNHNGLIEVNSNPGAGTSFNIYFPELLSKKTHAAKSQAISHKGNGENVLVVDDEEFFISIMRDYLIHMNYNPSIFRDSMEALAEIKDNKSKYSLIITDLSMPNMSGIEFISEIKKMEIHVPIILCTGFSEDVTEDTAHYYGITQFLLKPVSKSDIERAISQIFSQKK